VPERGKSKKPEKPAPNDENNALAQFDTGRIAARRDGVQGYIAVTKKQDPKKRLDEAANKGRGITLEIVASPDNPEIGIVTNIFCKGAGDEYGKTNFKDEESKGSNPDLELFPIQLPSTMTLIWQIGKFFHLRMKIH
jgi:hypothetical protein